MNFGARMLAITGERRCCERGVRGTHLYAARLLARFGGVRDYLRDVVAEGKTVTYDLGGSAGTREFGEAVAARVRAAS